MPCYWSQWSRVTRSYNHTLYTPEVGGGTFLTTQSQQVTISFPNPFPWTHSHASDKVIVLVSLLSFLSIPGGMDLESVILGGSPALWCCGSRPFFYAPCLSREHILGFQNLHMSSYLHLNSFRNSWKPHGSINEHPKNIVFS